jgi:hypothetical protein
MKPIKLLVIDAEKKQIYEKEIDSSLKSMQSIVGGYIECAHNFKNKNEIYVNEEGLFREGTIKGFVVFGAHQPFAGSGFVVSVDEKGNFIDSTMNIKDLEMLVKYVEFESNF